jgi:hypothetical protein
MKHEVNDEITFKETDRETFWNTSTWKKEIRE